jgi:prepilin-type N-terminal cleavage/methylation domain-containing protein
MRRRSGRGFTLLESVIAMAVLLIGAAGMLGLQVQGIRMDGDARRITRASAIAQDLMNQVALWPWGDPRLGDATGLDDTRLATLGDPGFAFEASPPPAASFSDADLTTGGTTWHGIPTADIAAAGYQRYWNVAYVDDSNSNGVPDSVRVAVIVRYPAGAGFRRVVLLGTKINPAEAR